MHAPASVIRPNTAREHPVFQIPLAVMPYLFKAMLLSDERTNIMIIFSQADNFPFFEKIIEVLDVTVEPETTFEVINLEYADAEELATTLNSLIGTTSSAQQNNTTRNSNTGRNTTIRRNNENSQRNRTPVRANRADTSGIGI